MRTAVVRRLGPGAVAQQGGFRKVELQRRPRQLEITDPANGNALHGLLSGAAYSVADRTADSITLATDVTPAPGYPFELGTAVRYQLTQDGLLVTHSLTNTGSRCAPVAVGAHPFLNLGTVPTEDLALFITADTHIEIDERLNPTGATTAVRGPDTISGPRNASAPSPSTTRGATSAGNRMGARSITWRPRTAARCNCSWTPPLAMSRRSPQVFFPATGVWSQRWRGTDDSPGGCPEQRRGTALAGPRRDVAPQLGHPLPTGLTLTTHRKLV